MLAGRAGLIRWCHYLREASVPDFGQAVWKGKPGFGFGSIQRGCGWQWRSLVLGFSEALPNSGSLSNLGAAWLAAKLLKRVQSRVLAPGIWEEALVPAEQGSDGPAVLSLANLRLQRLRSCLGTRWGAAVQTAEMGNTASRH